MAIQPQLYTLTELISKRLFRIPNYQRAYSWQAKQRKDLFEDIERSFEEGNGKDHFMATIVGLYRDDKISIYTDEYQVVEIVDGQQRITTLSLLFKAIAKTIDRSDDNVSGKRTGQELDEILIKPDGISPLLQTNHDRNKYLADYLRTGNYPAPKEAKTLADRELLMAMKECEAFVNKWRDSGNSLVDLVSHLKNRLFFIFHNIDDEALVYTVFEVLNSRGLDVSWFDRLKSMLMAIVFESKNGNKAEIIKEVHDLWAEMYRVIGLRLGLNTESLRFAATLWQDNTQSRVLSEANAVGYLRERSGEPSKVIETTKWVLSVTKALDELRQNVRINAVTRIAQARLVATAINLREDLTKCEKARVFRVWENVTFRIYGMYRKDARTAVGDYTRLAWRIVHETLPVDQILEGLSAIGTRYPTIEAVEQLKKINCYEGWKEELRYFFYRYEEHLSQDQNFDNNHWNLIWAGRTDDSIEHISPQSQDKSYTHWLGNLVLLPLNLNKKLLDKPPEYKAKKYTQTGMWIAQKVAKRIEQSSKWGQAEIQKREKELLDWAKKEWAD